MVSCSWSWSECGIGETTVRTSNLSRSAASSSLIDESATEGLWSLWDLDAGVRTRAAGGSEGT